MKNSFRHISVLLAFVMLFSLCLSFAVLPSGAAADGTEAEDITQKCRISMDGGVFHSAFIDSSYFTYEYINAGSVITVSCDTAIAGIYLRFNQMGLMEYPGEWYLDYGNGTVACGQDGMQQQYVGGFVSNSLTITFPETVWLCDIFFLSEGELPGWVHAWEPAPEAADLLIMACHGDDDQYTYTGLIPWALSQGYEVQVAYFINHYTHPNRVHETLDGLWESGLRCYPELGRFTDMEHSTTLESYLSTGYTEDDLLEAVVDVYRRYKPKVVVGHDLDGEYGHGAHVLFAKLTIDAALLSPDPDRFPDSAEKYGVWEIPKLYVHLLDRNAVILDFDKPLDMFGGRTAYKVAQDAFLMELSQLQYQGQMNYMYGQNLASEVTVCPPTQYGLYLTGVGPDENTDTLFDHITTHAEDAAAAEAERLAKEEEERKALEEKATAAQAEAERLAQEEAARVAEEEAERQKLAELKKAAEEAIQKANTKRKLLIATVLLAAATVAAVGGLIIIKAAEDDMIKKVVVSVIVFIVLIAILAFMISLRLKQTDTAANEPAVTPDATVVITTPEPAITPEPEPEVTLEPEPEPEIDTVHIYPDDGITRIWSPDGLRAIADDPEGTYQLVENINMSGEEWTPIPFNGVLDGDGFAIYNLTVTEAGAERRISVDGNHKEYDTVYAGLFSTAENAEISNLELVNLRLNVTTDENCFAGGIAGYTADALITNCSIQGTLELHTTNYNVGLGGIAGFGTGEFSDCVTDTKLIHIDESDGIKCEQFTGGVIAVGYCTINRCSVHIEGYTSCHGYVHDGGLVGMHHHLESAYILRSYDNNVTGFVTFFEDNLDRRAYCDPYVGENLHWTMELHGCTDEFKRLEVYDYSSDLYPHTCGCEDFTETAVEPTAEEWGYTEYSCKECDYSYRDNYTEPLTDTAA